MQIYTQCLRAPCFKEISPAHLSPRAMLPQAFPRKLLALLETAPAGAIAWSSDGASIVIGDRRLLVACLAEHFAHAQFASFHGAAGGSRLAATCAAAAEGLVGAVAWSAPAGAVSSEFLLASACFLPTFFSSQASPTFWQSASCEWHVWCSSQ